MSSCDVFFLHVLPGGIHRIRHNGLIANNARKENLARVRELLHVAPAAAASDPELAEVPTDAGKPTFVYPHCGAPMLIIQTLLRERDIRAPPEHRGAP
jgi:hypothetical protein